MRRLALAAAHAGPRRRGVARRWRPRARISNCSSPPTQRCSHSSGLTTAAIAWLAASRPGAHGGRPALARTRPAARCCRCYSTPDYPELLRQSPDAPPVLYVRGSAAALREPQLAMVGSRNPTAGGRATAREFAAAFRASRTVHHQRPGAGHRRRLPRGRARCRRPHHRRAGARARHRLPAASIEHWPSASPRSGALVSEFPPGTPPLPTPLSAAQPHHRRPGAWHPGGGSSAGFGLADHRPPGRSRRPRGVRHARLHPQSAWRAAATNSSARAQSSSKRVEDVLAELKISLAAQLLADTSRSPPGHRAGAALDKEYKILLDALAFEPASVDSLIERTGMNSESIASMLLILELDGHVAPHPGGRYSRMAGQ